MTLHPMGPAPTFSPSLTDDAYFVEFEPSAEDLALLAVSDLTKQLKAQNDFASSIAQVTSREAIKALGDVISGQIKDWHFDPNQRRDAHGRWVRIPHVDQIKPPAKNWLGRKQRMSGIKRRGFGKTPVTFLVSFSQRDAMDYKSANLGRLLVPGNHPDAKVSELKGVPFAIDNGGFWGVPEKDYKDMIQEMHDLDVHPLWVTVPDVLIHNPDGSVTGDWKGTAERFEQWNQYLKHQGMPSALVAQNGLDSPEGLAWLDKHWDDIAAVFIGGDDDFKLGPGAAKITELAHQHGKLVHVGRVNTKQRVAYARDVLQADSFDGQNWNRFKVLKLEKGLEYAPTGDPPPTRVGRDWVHDAYEALVNGTAWPLPPQKASPQYPHGYYPIDSPRPAVVKADEVTEVVSGQLFYQPLADVLYDVGLADDDAHLQFDEGHAGFSIRYETRDQLNYFVASLGLPLPDIDADNIATWTRVLVVPGDPSDEPELEDDPRYKLFGIGHHDHFDPNQRRDSHGRWTDDGGVATIDKPSIGGTPTPPRNKPLDFETFKGIFDGFSAGGLTAKIRREDHWPPRGGKVTFDINDERGRHAGYGQYHFQGDTAHIDRIFLDTDAQDNGFATALHKHFFDTLREHGTKKVHLEAVEIGSYAWARAGFKWQRDPAVEQKRMYRDADLFAAHRNHVPQELFDELDRKVKAGEFSSEAELAAFGRQFTWKDQRGHTMWLGKLVMLNGDWDGERAP